VVEALTCGNRNGSSGDAVGLASVSAGQDDITEYC